MFQVLTPRLQVATAPFCGNIPHMPDIENMLTTVQAEQLSKELGHPLTRYAIAKAAQRGKAGNETGIPGCIKLGDGTSNWLIPRDMFVDWLKTPRKTGPKPKQ